jgi:CBS domain containing-hemolysin-like protein
MVTGLILVFILVFVTAFFVAIEFALVSVRKTRIDQLVSEGNAGAKLVKHALENLNTYLAAAQVGITLATIGLGTLGEPVVAQIFVPMLEKYLPHDIAHSSAHGIAFVFALLLVTILELILGETVPKIAAIQRAEATSVLLIRPMRLFMLVFKPFVWLINFLSGAVLRLIGLPPDTGHGSVYTVEELEMLVTSSRQAGVLDREEEVILRRVFDFGDLTARQVMRPRTEIEGVPVTATFSELMQTMTESKHSRYPVYEGDLDNIVGVLHVRDVFEVLAHAIQPSAAIDGTAPHTSNGTGTHSPTASVDARFNVRALMRPIDAVPETVNVAELLERMQKQGIQMITVIDEYGGTAGIVTLEDVVEEIVGEVRDEFESGEEEAGIVTTSEGTLIDGLMAIDDVNEALGLSLESESDTLGGYVFEMLGRKPELGDEVTSNGYTLRVEELDNLRIAKVRVLSAKNADKSKHEVRGED